MYAPRFIAIGHAAQYGARDEVTGYRLSVLATAETQGWLDHLLKPFEPWEQDYDFYIRVIDTQPEKVLDNWGPKIPVWGFVSTSGSLEVLETEDLPF